MRRLWLIGAVLIIAVGSFVTYVANAPCQTVIPIFDSQQTQNDEGRELWPMLQRAHEDNLKRTGEYATLLPFLPAPVRVESISGKWANIIVTGPVPDGQLENAYGAAWQDVCVRHHHVAASACVFVHFAWSSGGVNTDCCSEYL